MECNKFDYVNGFLQVFEYKIVKEHVKVSLSPSPDDNEFTTTRGVLRTGAQASQGSLPV